MIKEETKKLIENAVDIEHENAKGYGEKFASDHEAWAVLLEEKIEAQKEFEKFSENLEMIFKHIMDGEKEELTEEINHSYFVLKNCACEIIQCMAVLAKWSETNEC